MHTTILSFKLHFDHNPLKKVRRKLLAKRKLVFLCLKKQTDKLPPYLIVVAHREDNRIQFLQLLDVMWSDIAQLRPSFPNKQMIKSNNQPRSDRRNRQRNVLTVSWVWRLQFPDDWTYFCGITCGTIPAKQHCTCSNMRQPRFQTQVVVRWIGLLAGSTFKMATLEIRLKRVNKIYFEGVSDFFQTLSLNSCTQ